MSEEKPEKPFLARWRIGMHRDGRIVMEERGMSPYCRADEVAQILRECLPHVQNSESVDPQTAELSRRINEFLEFAPLCML